jgi:hypothetical protein
MAREDQCICLESVRIGCATASHFCIAKDVSVLRVNHAAGEDVLPGVREITCPSDTINQLSWCAFSETLEGAKENNMLWTIFVVLLVLWLLGFSLHIAGGLIHLLLVVALVVLLINLFSGRGAVV